MSNGYNFKFPADDRMLDELIDFIKVERLCCDFFIFQLIVDSEHISLSITGPEGVKEFLENEVGL
jgi:hypothetical protein